MENKTNPKNAAFANLISSNGCTKREYFAALAMQGLLTRTPKRHGDETDLGIIEAKRIVSESRIIADLLIEELNEGGKDE
jgi:Mn-dependent DtxR family transcriptional regulator